MLPTWSAASATRVSHAPALHQRLPADGCQSDTSPRIAPLVVAPVVAATVVRKVTWPRSATSLETCPRSSAATATSMDTPAASAPSLVTVSLVSPSPEFYMLIVVQILGSNARTARSTATPRSAAPSLMLKRTVELVPTVVVSILSTLLPTRVLPVVMPVATGTPTPVALVAIGTPTVVEVVGKLLPSFSTHSTEPSTPACHSTECWGLCVSSVWNLGYRWTTLITVDFWQLLSGLVCRGSMENLATEA